MGQLHMYVTEDKERWLRAEARRRGMPISRLLAEIVDRELSKGWPEGFFEEVVGGWKGPPLRRPRQGRAEEREPL